MFQFSQKRSLPAYRLGAKPHYVITNIFPDDGNNLLMQKITKTN